MFESECLFLLAKFILNKLGNAIRVLFAVLPSLLFLFETQRTHGVS